MPQKSMWPKALSSARSAFVLATILAVGVAGLLLAAIWLPDWQKMRSTADHLVITEKSSERTRWAESLMGKPDPLALPAIDAAMNQEKDPAAKWALKEAQAAARLNAPIGPCSSVPSSSSSDCLRFRVKSCDILPLQWKMNCTSEPGHGNDRLDQEAQRRGRETWRQLGREEKLDAEAKFVSSSDREAQAELAKLKAIEVLSAHGDRKALAVLKGVSEADNPPAVARAARAAAEALEIRLETPVAGRGKGAGPDLPQGRGVDRLDQEAQRRGRGNWQALGSHQRLEAEAKFRAANDREAQAELAKLKAIEGLSGYGDRKALAALKAIAQADQRPAVSRAAKAAADVLEKQLGSGNGNRGIGRGASEDGDGAEGGDATLESVWIGCRAVGGIWGHVGSCGHPGSPPTPANIPTPARDTLEQMASEGIQLPEWRVPNLDKRYADEEDDPFFRDLEENSLAGRLAKALGIQPTADDREFEQAMVRLFGTEQIKNAEEKIERVMRALVPKGVGEITDLYEAATGRNAFNGASLTVMERATATFGALTLGAATDVLEVAQRLAGIRSDEAELRALERLNERSVGAGGELRLETPLPRLPAVDPNAALAALEPKVVHTALGEFSPTPGVVTTLIGSRRDLDDVKNQFPTGYVFKPRPGGVNILSVPDKVFEAMEYADPAKFWREVNEPWISAAIARGDQIILVTPPIAPVLFNEKGRSEYLTYIGQELKYLNARGYIYDPVTGKTFRF